MTRRNAAPGTLQVRQRIARVSRSITKASPKLFAMKATRRLSGETSARSPKCVSTSTFARQAIERAVRPPSRRFRREQQERGEPWRGRPGPYSHSITTSETPWRGSANVRDSVPAATLTVLGSSRRARPDAASSSAYCGRVGAIGEPIRFQAA